MLNDLVELATTVVHPDHEPDIAGSHKRMARRRQGSKSQSISSIADVNGMPPPASPASKSGTITRKQRSPASPKPNASAAIHATQEKQVRSIPRFFAAIALNLVANLVLSSLTAQFHSSAELATIAKVPSSYDTAITFSWQTLQMAIYWFGGFDAYDVASLTVLSQTPTNVLLNYFYLIRPTTIYLLTGTQTLANALPLLILTPLSAFHTPSQPHSKTSLRNRPILTDPFTTLATTILTAIVFTVIVELSFITFLPSFLITRFETLRTLEPAHQTASAFPILTLALIPSGYACTEYLFAPSTAATPFTAPDFNPATSGLLAHLQWNAWGWYTARQRMLISRAAVLGALLMVETLVATWGAVQGVEFVGALGYTGVWLAGVSVVGVVLDWVGGPSDWN